MRSDLKLDDIFKSNIPSFVYKATNNPTQSCFQDYLMCNSNTHGFETRQVERGDLYMKHRNTTMYGLRSMIIMEQYPNLYSRFTT